MFLYWNTHELFSVQLVEKIYTGCNFILSGTESRSHSRLGDVDDMGPTSEEEFEYPNGMIK